MYDIEKAMKGVDKSEKQIVTMVTYMNYHLQLLYSAIQSNDIEAQQFQKSQLEHIRQRLMELEYFPYEPVR